MPLGRKRAKRVTGRAAVQRELTSEDRLDLIAAKHRIPKESLRKYARKR